MARFLDTTDRDGEQQFQTAQATPTPPPLNDAIIRQVPATADLVALFAERAAVAGAEVHHTSGSELADVFGRVAPGGSPPGVLYHPEVLDYWPQLQSLFDGASVHPGADDRRVFEAYVGVTVAEIGIAETGTILCGSAANRARSTSLVPPTHIAVLDARHIVADMWDYFSNLPTTEMPANLNLITGPSKTADIEGILVTGVHGPGRLVVIVVESGG